jgi:hypothetical protein
MVFTSTQDNSNLRQPPKKICLPREFVFIQIKDDPTNTKSAQKTFYCYYAFIFLTPIPNISIPFTFISQYIISPIHYTEYTALLKTLHSHFWWDALPCCYDPQWLNNTCICLDLWTYLNPWRFTVFSTDGDSGVKNINRCVLNFCVMPVVCSH